MAARTKPTMVDANFDFSASASASAVFGFVHPFIKNSSTRGAGLMQVRKGSRRAEARARLEGTKVSFAASCVSINTFQQIELGVIALGPSMDQYSGPTAWMSYALLWPFMLLTWGRSIRRNSTALTTTHDLRSAPAASSVASSVLPLRHVRLPKGNSDLRVVARVERAAVECFDVAARR